MSAELVLHLELDEFEVVDGKEIVKDASSHNHIGALQGEVDIVVDDTFGACASFDGNPGTYITVPSDNLLKITGELTVATWVYITNINEKTGWARIVGGGQNNADPEAYGLWYVASSTTMVWLFQRGPGTPFGSCQVTTQHSTTPLNIWYHVAGVVKGQKTSLYVHDLQGKLIAKVELDNTPTGGAFGNDAPLTIGYAPNVSVSPPHTGRIAHVRVYNGACTQAEIERDIASDRLALVPFRKSHPIDFHLYNDDDDQALLYISDDPAGYNLRLELHNTSAQSIQLHNNQGDVASEDNHHFALRFRPGTLSDSTLKALVAPPQERAKILKQAEQWDLYFPPTLPAANEAAVLYLLYKGPTTSFQPNERRTVTLQRMSAAPGSGARGTQVELLPHQLTAQGGDATPITGNRTQYMHITNRIGHKYIPLHVWFEGGNTVLNDGVASTTLTLCIGNASVDRDITLNATSKFLISFDVGDGADAAWALTTSAYESKVHVKSGGNELPLTAAGQGISRQWSVQFPQETVLLRRGSLEEDKPPKTKKPLKITIEDIQTSPQASGHANLYVRYEGIPGYQDGQFILTVDKSPLVVRKGNVGIGTSETEAKLSIKGGVHIGGDADPGDKNLRVDGQILSNALQLGESGPLIHAIIAAATTPNIKGDASLPTVSFVTELVERAIKPVMLSSMAVRILVPVLIYANPFDPPRASITANKVTFAGTLRLLPGSQDQFIITSERDRQSPLYLIRFYPPPVTQQEDFLTIQYHRYNSAPFAEVYTYIITGTGDLYIPTRPGYPKRTGYSGPETHDFQGRIDLSTLSYDFPSFITEG
jgi:hypothetical protein